ncbi:MAG: hypothetical protein ACREM2_08940, partial [Vulcanimicrobiaceae bacterium]
NYIVGLEPPSGTRVGPNPEIGGITEPNATVTIVGTSGGSFDQAGAPRAATVADGRGLFSARLDLGANAGPSVEVRIRSVAPSGAVAQRTLQLVL